MKNRLVAAAVVAALGVVPLAATSAWATPAAAPSYSPSVAASTTDDPAQITRQLIDAALDRSADRLVEAKTAQALRLEVTSPEQTPRETLRETAAAGQFAAAATTSRIFGANRYDTAVKISQNAFAQPADFGGFVFIANGLNFPDALAAGPAAASLFGPILLTPPTTGLPGSVKTEIARLKALNPAQPLSIVLLGGSDNVSAQAEADAKVLAPEANAVFRVAGTSRYETSALLADLVVKWVQISPGVWDAVEPDTVIITNGLTFADALAGGAAGGWEYAPLLLTAPGGLDGSVSDVLTPIPADPGTGYPGQEYRTVRILGSAATVSTTVETQIRGLLPRETVFRYSGTDRFDTAARLNAAVFDGPVYEVTLTNGLRFPDALAGAPRVHVTGGPTIPVRTECLPTYSAATLTALTPSFVTALGNVDAVSAAALNGSVCG